MSDYKDPINLKQDRALVDRCNKVCAPCNHLTYFPLVVDSYNGAILKDVDGNEYIDFLASASSMNLGGSHPAILKACREQLEKVTQYSAAYTYNEPMIRYSEKLTSVYPGGGPAKVCYGNCGSDCNDAAIKFARAFTGRTKIISFNNAYHGNTFGSSSLTHVTHRMHKNMGPFLPEMYSFPYSDCAHCMFDQDPASCSAQCLRPIEQAFKTSLDPEEVAAVIIEPIQGDGGIIPANQLFMDKLFKLCHDNGILFISEEVQQGLGRTGKWFSIEHFNIVPDGIIMGKSVGGGFPLGAFMARPEIMDCLPEVAHVFTLAGNHMSCAAGAAAFDVVAEPGFLDSVNEKGEYLRNGFRKLGEKYGIIKDVRGLGLSIGVEIVKDLESNEPDVNGVAKMCYRAFEKGLVMISLAGNVFRVQPPLIISKEEIDRALAIIDETMDEYTSGEISDEVLSNVAGW